MGEMPTTHHCWKLRTRHCSKSFTQQSAVIILAYRWSFNKRMQPRDGGAWWEAIYGVTQSRTRLKRLSSSSSRSPNTLRHSSWINVSCMHLEWYELCTSIGRIEKITTQTIAGLWFLGGTLYGAGDGSLFRSQALGLMLVFVWASPKADPKTTIWECIIWKWFHQ